MSEDNGTINKCRTHLAPFERAYLPPEAFSYQRHMDLYGMTKADAKRVVARFKDERVYKNDAYQVNVLVIDETWVHLSIKRIDKAPIHDWRDLQAIKNMIVGPEHEGIELYPAESRLVDTANQYHLWCLRKGQRFPVGFIERMVIDSGQGAPDNSVQRELPQPHQPEGDHP